VRQKHMGKPWAERGAEALALLQSLHPHFQVKWTEADWARHAPTTTTVIPGSCYFCGLDLQGTIQDILIRKQRPGSAIVGVSHECTVIESSTVVAQRDLQDTSHVLIEIQMVPDVVPIFEAGMDGLVRVKTGKRQAVAVTRCTKCKRKCHTAVRSLKTGHPACWCGGRIGCWKDAQGFKRAVQLIRNNAQGTACEAAFSLIWWNENAVSCHTHVPLRCKTCRHVRTIGLQTLRLGYGPCPKCPKASKKTPSVN
jgi:hypothetical protein